MVSLTVKLRVRGVVDDDEDDKPHRENELAIPKYKFWSVRNSGLRGSYFYTFFF